VILPPGWTWTCTGSSLYPGWIPCAYVVAFPTVLSLATSHSPPDCTPWLVPEAGSWLAMSGAVKGPCYQHLAQPAGLSPRGWRLVSKGTAHGRVAPSSQFSLHYHNNSNYIKPILLSGLALRVYGLLISDLDLLHNFWEKIVQQI